MAEYEAIQYERKGHIAYITLNRPEVLNALNGQMTYELGQAWAEVDADPEVYVTILSGNGRAFCSGMDVRGRLDPSVRRAPGAEGRPRMGGGDSGGIRGYQSSSNWKPIIAAIHGYAYGAGYLYAAAADLVVAAEGTKMEITETRTGLAAGSFWVGAWFYSGSKFANEIAVTGRSFTAEEALRHGMVNRVVPVEKLMETAEEMAELILKNPPLSVRATVRSIRRLPQELARAASLYESTLKLEQTEDFREAARAFLEKRPPEFRGR